MRACYANIRPFVNEVSAVQGPLLELGVYLGDTFAEMAQNNPQKTCIGVDSFQGMGKPTVMDYDSEKKKHCYPEGALNNAGHIKGSELPNTVLIRGWVPHIFENLPLIFPSFAHVDLDQYLPTLISLQWLWIRMPKDSIIAVHDWYPEKEILASAAIKDFAKQIGIEPKIHDEAPNHAWFKKA